MNTMIISLPEDVIMFHIKPYMSPNDIYLTNKIDYKIHKTEMFTSLQENERQSFSVSYITRIIRKDYAFLFEILLNVMFKHWYKALKIKYKDSRFSSYIDLLNHQCIEYNSNSCRNLIINKLGQNGIRKNKFKRIRIRNHKWNN
jgi:hypothetical protein